MASQESTAQIGIDANLTKIFLRKSPESLSPAEVEAYRCFICRLLLRQPSQLSCCGRRSCRSCIDGKRRNRKIFHCPKCNEEIGDGGDERNYVFTDASCVNDMKNMETVCNTKPSPCKWRGKVSMLEIIFKSGTKVLVNRQNFEWNKSSFSEEFKATTSASEFITVWQRITTVDSRTQQSVHRSESSYPESSQASSSHSTQSTVSVDSEVVPPASKRLYLERPSTVTTGSADHGQSPLNLNPIGDVILSKRKENGNLMQPQSDLRLIRKLDTTFVNNLKKRIQEDPTGPAVPPIAALCVNVNKENFTERYKDSYRYEVLGGQRTVTAKAELLRENPSNSLYNQVFAEVYIDLSEKESLKLASRHNISGHFIHRMSHKDYVQSCQAMLYSISSEDIPTPTIHWKEICKECILSPDMSRTQCENIFSQAVFAPLVWEKAVIVMQKFEDGKPKDQKLSKKSLISKPEFKQHHFQFLHNLAPSFQEQILQQVADCKITLEEMKKQSNNFRALENVKKVFARATTTNSSWEEARVRFPWHTSEENFSQFLGLNFNKGVPDSFRSYIQAALKGEKHYEKNRHVYQGSEAVVIELSINNITLAKVQQSYPSYSGSNLILTSIPKENQWLSVQP